MKVRKYALYGLFLFCATNILYLIFAGFFKGGKDSGIQGFDSVHLSRLSQSKTKLYGRTEIEIRAGRVARICRDLDIEERLSENSPFVVSSYQFYDRSMLCVCDVPKAASTSIKRALLAIEYPERAEFFEKLPGYQIHLQKEIRNVTVEKCFKDSATSFMVTRDPYTRLYSAYVDKIYLAKFHLLSIVLDAAYNKGVTQEKIEEMLDQRMGSALICGLPDVSFEQFLNYVVMSPRLDIHYAPVSLMCKPCGNHFDILLKQETLEDDFDQFFDTVFNIQNKTAQDFSVKNYSGETGIESLIMTFYTHWKIWLKKYSCKLDKQTYDAINQRLWNGLKLLGSIDENLEIIEELFRRPVGEEIKLRSPDAIIYEFKANKVPYLKPEDRERQRLKFLKKAYQSVDRKVLRQIQQLFQFDFILFDYDTAPPG